MKKIADILTIIKEHKEHIETFDRHIVAIDKQIDALVYILNNLTKEEIKLWRINGS